MAQLRTTAGTDHDETLTRCFLAEGAVGLGALVVWPYALNRVLDGAPAGTSSGTILGVPTLMSVVVLVLGLLAVHLEGRKRRVIVTGWACLWLALLTWFDGGGAAPQGSELALRVLHSMVALVLMSAPLLLAPKGASELKAARRAAGAPASRSRGALPGE